MNEKKKVYISGKMRYLDEEESRRLFLEAQRKFESEGYEVVNPWDLEEEKKAQCKDWGDFIIFDLPILKTCDKIYMLKNWYDSWGARTEHDYAKGNGIEVVYQSLDDIPETKQRKISDDYHRFLYHEALQQNCTQDDIKTIIFKKQK